ncbi:MAG TPA: hypothetical protein V6D13_20620 [Halomicronema sp.]
MNQYFDTLQLLKDEAYQVLNNVSNSVEMRAAAESLNESTLPCIEEIKRSATTLKNLTQICIKNLDHAEDVWLSKAKITEVPTSEIWEQIGELTGLKVRINLLAEQCRIEVIKQVNQVWEEKAKNARTLNFWDNGKKVFKSSLNFFEKDRLFKQIRSDMDSYENQINLALTESLKLVLNQVKYLNIQTLKKWIQSFDTTLQLTLLGHLEESTKEVELKFSNSTSLPSEFDKGYKETLNIPLNSLLQKSMMGVSLDQFEDFSKEVVSITEKLILSIFNDRLNSAIKVIEELIFFYNDLLDKQTRYRQETPEQREAEKAWIDQQRLQLAQVQQGTEAILEAGSFAESLSEK